MFMKVFIRSGAFLSLLSYCCQKSVWVFSVERFSLSTFCSPAINRHGRLLDKEQEYSSQWILAAESGTSIYVRMCGFGPSWDIWKNAGNTQSPLALRVQPHIVSGFCGTTLKWSSSTKCGLFDGTFADFYTGWLHMTLLPSINLKCLFNIFYINVGL